MPKKKVISFRVEEEWLKALYGLAGTFGATPDEVIQQALPDVAVTRLFFQCKIYFPQLRWDEVADVILPSPTMHEKSGTLVNAEGRAFELKAGVTTRRPSEVEVIERLGALL